MTTDSARMNEAIMKKKSAKRGGARKRKRTSPLFFFLAFCDPLPGKGEEESVQKQVFCPRIAMSTTPSPWQDNGLPKNIHSFTGSSPPSSTLSCSTIPFIHPDNINSLFHLHSYHIIPTPYCPSFSSVLQHITIMSGQILSTPKSKIPPHHTLTSLSLTHVQFSDDDLVSKIFAHLTLSPLAITCGYIAVILTTRDLTPILMLAGQALNECVNFVLKRFVKQARPTGSAWITL